jgi:transposase-like protein
MAERLYGWSGVRNRSDEEKLAILKETTVPGVVISAVTRRHGIGTGQLYPFYGSDA